MCILVLTDRFFKSNFFKKVSPTFVAKGEEIKQKFDD